MNTVSLASACRRVRAALRGLGRIASALSTACLVLILLGGLALVLRSYQPDGWRIENNPTGQYRGLEDIQHMLDEHPERLLVLDEAYAPFVDDRWRSEALLERANLIILRSMTKDQALPGLRLGYLLAGPEVASAVERMRPPWSVNAGALRAGLAALEPAAEAHLLQAQALVAQSRRVLTDRLTHLGFEVEPSRANFVLVQVRDGRRFRRALLPHGFVVRDCASFGLPDCVRIACRLPEDCQRVLEAVARVACG